MSSNVGLTTPRGSGTSGYVQRNLSVLKPRAAGSGQPYSLDSSMRPPKTRKPDQAILAHDRLRDIEVKVLELRDKLEDEASLDEDEIDAKCDELRATLVREAERGGGAKRDSRGKAFKGYQVHEAAEAKERESERLRRALGLAGNSRDGKNGGVAKDDEEHPMARQERRKRERDAERVQADLDREEKLKEREKEREEATAAAARDSNRNRPRRSRRSRSLSSSRSRSYSPSRSP